MLNKKTNEVYCVENNGHIKMNDTKLEIHFPDYEIKHIIIDCSCVNFIDTQGISGILQVEIK